MSMVLNGLGVKSQASYKVDWLVDCNALTSIMYRYFHVWKPTTRSG